MEGLQRYHEFLQDIDEEFARIEAALARSGASGTPCRQGCSECCRPMTVLPLEACAILTEAGAIACNDHGTDPEGACAFLALERTCRIYAVRPFLCRTRGFPVLYMNGDGDRQSAACEKRGFPLLSADSPGIRLELWNARLFRLNDAFCRERGIHPARIRLADLRLRQTALLSPA